MELTLHVSRSASGSSIISLSIGSVMSHSWNAAVSFVIVWPSKMCAFLCPGDQHPQHAQALRNSLLALRVLLLHAHLLVLRRAVVAACGDRRARDRVVGVAEVQPLVATCLTSAHRPHKDSGILTNAS